MGIGTSMGAFHEDEFAHIASPWMEKPEDTPDNNVIDPNVDPEGIKPIKDLIMPVADFTPLNEKQYKDLMWDTPVVSSKDPDLREGTKQSHIDYMNEMLNITPEEHKRNFEATAKAVGRENLLGDVSPAGRIRGWSDIPAFQDFKDNLPDDVEVHDMKDGTWTFKKKPSALSDLVS